MKICSICNKNKENSDFYKDKDAKDGLYSCCKRCHLDTYKNKKKNTKEQQEYRRKYQEKYRQLNSKKQREKYLCRKKTHRLIKNGIIKKETCNICGNENVEIHHVNYDNPKNIIWICRKHHAELHNKLKNKI